MIIELRQYTLHPGQRDVLIDIFDREFVESQEETGMKVIGQFRDLDDPDRFVWLRGFPDMPSRARSLAAFYGGPVWKAHRDAANATMVDSDDVLLLRPATPVSGFTLPDRHSPAVRESAHSTSTVLAGVHRLDRDLESGTAELVTGGINDQISAARGIGLAILVSETSPNNFPALPIREGERVLVWLAGFDDRTAADAFSKNPGRIVGLLAACGIGARDTALLRLAPTSRSLLPGGTPG